MLQRSPNAEIVGKSFVINASIQLTLGTPSDISPEKKIPTLGAEGLSLQNPIVLSVIGLSFFGLFLWFMKDKKKVKG